VEQDLVCSSGSANSLQAAYEAVADLINDARLTDNDRCEVPPTAAAFRLVPVLPEWARQCKSLFPASSVAWTQKSWPPRSDS